MSDRQRRAANQCSRGIAFVAGLLLAACGGGGGGGSPTTSSPTPGAPPPVSSAVVTLDASNFDVVVATTSVCLLDFHHPSCTHCRAMEPVVEQLATDFEGQAAVGKVDVTTNQALATAWGVRAYPTFIVLKDGRQHSLWLGEASYARLAGMIRAAIAAP